MYVYSRREEGMLCCTDHCHYFTLLLPTKQRQRMTYPANFIRRVNDVSINNAVFGGSLKSYHVSLSPFNLGRERRERGTTSNNWLSSFILCHFFRCVSFLLEDLARAYNIPLPPPPRASPTPPNKGNECLYFLLVLFAKAA
jgi:hypothetical protein